MGVVSDSDESDHQQEPSSCITMLVRPETGESPTGHGEIWSQHVSTILDRLYSARQDFHVSSSFKLSRSVALLLLVCHWKQNAWHQTSCTNEKNFVNYHEPSRSITQHHQPSFSIINRYQPPSTSLSIMNRPQPSGTIINNHLLTIDPSPVTNYHQLCQSWHPQHPKHSA